MRLPFLSIILCPTVTTSLSTGSRALPQLSTANFPKSQLHRAPHPALTLSDTIPSTAAATAAPAADPSVWLDLWFPVCFSASVTDGTLVPATVFERPLVLFRDEQGAVQCLADQASRVLSHLTRDSTHCRLGPRLTCTTLVAQCPHRLAPLSEGRLATDPATGAARVECSYHGWQFAGCGRCTSLPQLEGTKPILPQYKCGRHLEAHPDQQRSAHCNSRVCAPEQCGRPPRGGGAGDRVRLPGR